MASRGIISVRMACLAYVVLLTPALLLQNPFRVGLDYESVLRQWYQQWVSPLAHLLAFTALGVLCVASRWRIGLGTMLVLLTLYAVATEALQLVIPGRTPEWNDLLQNLAGIGLAGLCTWWWRRRSMNVRDAPY